MTINPEVNQSSFAIHCDRRANSIGFSKSLFQDLIRSIFEELSLTWINFAPCIGIMTGYLTGTSNFAGQGFNRMCQPCNIVGFGKAMIAGLRERNNDILAQQSIDNF